MPKNCEFTLPVAVFILYACLNRVHFWACIPIRHTDIKMSLREDIVETLPPAIGYHISEKIADLKWNGSQIWIVEEKVRNMQVVHDIFNITGRPSRFLSLLYKGFPIVWDLVSTQDHLIA